MPELCRFLARITLLRAASFSSKGCTMALDAVILQGLNCRGENVVGKNTKSSWTYMSVPHKFG
jgi:hypothetical protein